MKRLNKKGFTLAELLIVIAIIAILIAIAIPAFGASLNSAKLQTDHANIRSAYAMYKTATMLNSLEDVDGGPLEWGSATTKTVYFAKDGTLTTDPNKAYVLQTTGSKDDCAASSGCLEAAGATGDVKDFHKESYHISIKITKDTSAAGGYKYKFQLAT